MLRADPSGDTIGGHCGWICWFSRRRRGDLERGGERKEKGERRKEKGERRKEKD
jgi:hypothetical protein